MRINKDKFSFFDYINKGVIIINYDYELLYYNKWIKTNLNVVNDKNHTLIDILPKNMNFLKVKIDDVMKYKNVLYLSYALHKKNLSINYGNKNIFFNLYIYYFEDEKIFLYIDNITNYINNLKKIKELNEGINENLTRLENENKKNRLLAKLTDVFNKSYSVKDVSKKLLNTLKFYYANSNLTLYLLEKNNKRLKLVASIDVEDWIRKEYSTILLDKEKALSAKILFNKAPLFINSIEEYAKKYEAFKKTHSKSVIFIPLVDFNGNSVGIIHVGFNENRSYKKDERDYIKLVSSYIGIGISKIILMDEQRKYAKSLKEEVDSKTKQLVDSNEKLKKIASLYSELVETQTELICKTDKDNRITFANKSFMNFFSKKKTNILNKKFTELIDKENYEIFLNTIKNINDINKSGDIQLKIKIGKSYKTISFLINKIFNDGKLDGYQIVGRDRTSRINAENIIKEQKELIKNSERLSMLGRVSASIIHEINTPVTYIRTNSEIIDEKIKFLIDKINDKEVNKSEIKKELDKIILMNNDIHEGTDRIVSITRNMRAFIKGESEKEQVFVSDIIYNALNIIYPKWNGKIEIINKVNEQDKIFCIKGQIEQVFINLLLNAINAVIKNNKRTIYIRAYMESKFTIIEIEDNGIGISKHNMEKIFNPLFSANILNEGTGLGLSIVKEIIDSHNGRIIVESEINKGTKFTIKIPLMEKKWKN